MAEGRIPSRLRAVLPWIITAAILALIFWRVDFGETLTHFKGANLFLFVPVVVGFFVYIFFINALAYYKVLSWFCCPISYWNILSVRGASYLLTSINAAAGQGGLMFWVARKQNQPVKAVFSSFLLLPVVDLLFLAIVLSLPLAINFTGGELLPPSTVSLLLWSVLVLWSLVIGHMVFWLGNWNGRFAGKIKNIGWLQSFNNAKPRNYMILLGIRCLQHIPGILAFYIGLLAFKGYVDFPVFLVRFFPALIMQSLPITVAQMGTAQSAWIMMFGSLVDHSILVAFTLSWNLVYFLTRVTIGALFFRGEAREYFQRRAAGENLTIVND